MEKKIENTKTHKKKSGLVMGIIVGGAIGSVISLLFAPEKGEKTRKKVSTEGKKLFKKGQSLAEQFLEKYDQN